MAKNPVQLNNITLNFDNLAGGSFAVGDSICGQVGATSATIVTLSMITTSTGLLYLKDIQNGDGGFDNNEQISTGTVTADCNGTNAATTWENTAGNLYWPMTYGSYFLFSDYGVGSASAAASHSPQKWAYGDANITELITKVGATRYKFRYLGEYHNRIIGAYSNQTNGNIDIRWTNALPTMTDLEFPAANQLYKPTSDPINGVSRLGKDFFIIYGLESISQLVYYVNAVTPFGIETLVDGEGCDADHSIVHCQGANFFFNKNYGFVRYVGDSRITGDDVISKDIDSDIQGIDSRYYRLIQGKFIPFMNSNVWAVPLAGATTNTHLLYYNHDTKTWSKEDKVAAALDVWTRAAGEYKKPVFANTDGYVYQVTGETLPSTAVLNGYRIEPIMTFGNPTTFKNLQEIDFGIVQGGNWSIDVYHRSGHTVKEVEAASWTSVGSLSLNNPTNLTVFVNQTARLHQIKWGSETDSEKFCINWIIYRYTEESNK